VRAGEKNRRIEIQKLTVSKNSLGENVETWSVFRSVWAKVTYMNMRKGGEVFVAMMVQSEQWLVFKIDYISGISPKTFRIKWEGDIYDIRSANEGGDYKEYLEITARATGV
jgi:SPP1 family predicted phage head-tail adaptor